jgi:hypothetical protein
MAGCNDDIILRKDNVICDKGSGISLKDFILKVLQDEGISGSTGGNTGGGGSSSSSLFVSASDQSGTAAEITLPNSGQPLIIKSTRADIVVTRSGNQIIIGDPPAACTAVASPTITSFTLDVSQLEIGVTKNSFIPTFVTGTPAGSATTVPGYQPNCTSGNSAWTSFQVVAALSSGNQTFTSVVSGSTKNLSPSLSFTAPGQTCVFTLTGTGTKSDGTSHTATATATITAKFKVFSGYVLASTSPGSITTSSLTGSSLVTSIAGTYGNSGHPGTGACYFYFAIPSTFNLTTAYLGTNGFSFLGASDGSNNYTNSDSYNNGDATTYYKTITYNGINYSLYRSNNSTLAAFGNITIT